jgi:hypothetical protein
MNRVMVIRYDGKALPSCSPARARELLRGDKAIMVKVKGQKAIKLKKTVY